MTPRDPAIEEARRRVYSPRVTEQDRAEYRRLLEHADPQPAPGGHLDAAEPADPVPNPDPSAGRRPWRPVLLGCLVAGVLIATAIVAALPREEPRIPLPTPTPVSVDPAIRAAFVADLRAGRAAGIARYLHSERPETPLRDATRYVVVERWGTGPRAVPIRPAGQVQAAGRATVILVVAEPARVIWTLSALPYLHAGDLNNALGTRVGDAEAGTPGFASFRYHATTVPTTLRVDVPDGVRWGAAVVLSD